MRMKIISALVLTAVLLTLTLGCDSDSNPGATQTGTIAVNPDPNELTATWQITGPDGYSRSGTGDTTLESLAPGEYTLTWSAVTGYAEPIPATATQTLTAGSTSMFSGTYAPYPDSPDRLMENFKETYDEMDAVTYDEEILHPDFVFKFADDTPEAISGPTGILTREQELTTTTNMFSGASGSDPVTGALKPPVQDVQFPIADQGQRLGGRARERPVLRGQPEGPVRGQRRVRARGRPQPVRRQQPGTLLREGRAG